MNLATFVRSPEWLRIFWLPLPNRDDAAWAKQRRRSVSPENIWDAALSTPVRNTRRCFVGCMLVGRQATAIDKIVTCWQICWRNGAHAVLRDYFDRASRRKNKKRKKKSTTPKHVDWKKFGEARGNLLATEKLCSLVQLLRSFLEILTL